MNLENYIMKELHRFAASDDGKKLIAKKTGVDYNPVEVEKYCQKMKEILFNHIHEHIKSFNIDDIIIGDVRKNKNGQLSAVISFEEDSLFRPSLQPRGVWEGENIGKKNGETGIIDIVLAFTYGWESRGAIQGVWHGNEEVWSKPKRAGEAFLEDAVNEFNNKNSGVVTAKLAGEYRYRKR